MPPHAVLRIQNESVKPPASVRSLAYVLAGPVAGVVKPVHSDAQPPGLLLNCAPSVVIAWHVEHSSEVSCALPSNICSGVSPLQTCSRRAPPPAVSAADSASCSRRPCAPSLHGSPDVQGERPRQLSGYQPRQVPAAVDVDRRGSTPFTQLLAGVGGGGPDCCDPGGGAAGGLLCPFTTGPAAGSAGSSLDATAMIATSTTTPTAAAAASRTFTPVFMFLDMSMLPVGAGVSSCSHAVGFAPCKQRRWAQPLRLSQLTC